MDEKFTEIQEARKRLASFMGPEDSKELRKLFRQLAKKLHPDVNPDLSPQAMALWLQVLDAYENGNIEEMRALSLIAEDMPDGYEPPSSLDALREHRDKLSQQVRKMLEAIAEIKSAFPFTVEKQLSDPECVAAMQEEIDGQLVAAQAKIEELEMIVAGLMESTIDA